MRGIARGVGSTSLAASLAFACAMREEHTLILDLSLWNCDLTKSFDCEPGSGWNELAREFDNRNALSLDLVQRFLKTRRPNLDLLPGTRHWLELSSLRGENGWNFIQSLFLCAKQHWHKVVVDLGSHLPNDNQRDVTFLVPCAVHASVLQASRHLVNVFDAIEYLQAWRAAPNRDTSLQAKMVNVVNKYHANLPFGLDKLRLNQDEQIQTYLVPFLKDGLLPKHDGLFFMERSATVAKPTGAERTATRVIQEVAACTCQ